MDIAEPISGTHRDTVARRVVRLARAGDLRARRVTLWGRPGVVPDRTAVVTPHRDADGALDVADLAAQVYALAHECPSVTGTYTGGCWVSADGTGHLVFADVWSRGDDENDDDDDEIDGDENDDEPPGGR